MNRYNKLIFFTKDYIFVKMSNKTIQEEKVTTESLSRQDVIDICLRLQNVQKKAGEKPTIPQNFRYEDYNCGTFIDNLKKAYNKIDKSKDLSSPEKIEKLKKFDDLMVLDYWNDWLSGESSISPYDRDFDENLRSFIEYERSGKTVKQNLTLKEHGVDGRWLLITKRKHTKGSLSYNQLSDLLKLKYWTGDSNGKSSDRSKKIELILEYETENPDRNFIGKGDDTPDRKIYKWFEGQRTKLRENNGSTEGFEDLDVSRCWREYVKLQASKNK